MCFIKSILTSISKYQQVASILFYDVCYKCGLRSEDRNKISELIKMAGSVIGVTSD